MIRDLLHDQPGPDSRFDVCVVGAGAAGIVLAVELARLGKRVALLEAGGREIEEESQELYRSEVSPAHQHRGIHTGRFRVHGGTTRKWGGQILELDDIDFEKRSWVPGSGWPISKADLKSSYERALVLEGLGEVIRDDVAVWRSAGASPPALPHMQPYFSRWCPEPDFSRLHRARLESPDIAVWLHANVVATVESEGQVTALRCRTLHGQEALFHADEFVFCLGAIESVRFFLQPRGADLPWNASGLLGKHFQDHIDCNAAAVEVLDRKRFHAIFDNVYLKGYKYHSKVRLQASVQEQLSTLDVAATMYFVSSQDELLDRTKSTAKRLLRGRIGEVRAADILRLAANLPLLARQSFRYSIAHRAYNPPEAKVWLRVHCEQEPASQSSLRLTDDPDPLGMLRTRLDWRISATECVTIREFVLQAQKALHGVADLQPDPDLMSGDPAFIARCDDSNHHMGGMKMAASPREGVVDLDLRVHGTKNCYVCSGAVFPTSGFSNPTHTVLALAVRLAQHLTRGTRG